MKENLAIKPHEPRKLRFPMSHPEETANKTTHVTFDQWNIFGKHVICHHWLSPPCWERFIGWNMDENGVFQNQTSTNRPKKTSSKQITTVKHCENPTWKSSLNLSISTCFPPFCHHFSQCFPEFNALGALSKKCDGNSARGRTRCWSHPDKSNTLAEINENHLISAGDGWHKYIYNVCIWRCLNDYIYMSEYIYIYLHIIYIYILTI